MKLKKYSLKNRIVIYFVFGAVLLLTLFYSQIEQHFVLYPHIDTRFAKNFDPGEFEEVKKGMSKMEVVGLFGEPLSKNTVSNVPECWHYSGDGKVSPYADFSWYSYKVCFEKELVKFKSMEEIFN